MNPDAILQHIWGLAAAGSRVFLGVGFAENAALKTLAVVYVYGMYVLVGLITLALLWHFLRFYQIMRGSVEDSALAVGKGILALALLFELIRPVTPNHGPLAWLQVPAMIYTDPYVVSTGVNHGGREAVAQQIMRAKMPTYWWLILCGLSSEHGERRASCRAFSPGRGRACHPSCADGGCGLVLGPYHQGHNGN